MIRAFFARSVAFLKPFYQAVALNFGGRSPEVFIFVHIPQDLDMLLPLVMRLHKSTRYRVRVTVSSGTYEQSPRIGKSLIAAGIQPEILHRKAVMAGLQPQFGGAEAVITASESTADAHRMAYALTQKANREGIFTYTMQHGFENIGLTYSDEEYPIESILFGSQTLFTWVPVAELLNETPIETREKCTAVGCPKFVDAPGLSVQVPGKKADDRLVVVFENLHWARYSDRYRQRFLQDLEATVAACPDVIFLVKPHHAGMWLTKRYKGHLPDADNVIIADPKSLEWEAFTAPALIEVADMIITTPSTVAIDAGRAGCPVAVVAYDMDLPNYEPLPLLRSEEDWRSLCAKADRNSPKLTYLTQTFAETRLIPGDAVQRIVDRIAQDISAPSP